MNRKSAVLAAVVTTLAACGIQSPPQPAGNAASAPEVANSAPADQAEKATDEAIKEIHRAITSVDHQPFADPPRLALTMKGSGWDAAGIFYGFATDARSVLEKLSKSNMLPVGEDVMFILRVEDTTGEWRNVLHLLVPRAAIEGLAAAQWQNADNALLLHAQVDYNGRMGREVVGAFCSSDKYQGATGLMSAPAFCDRAVAQ